MDKYLGFLSEKNNILNPMVGNGNLSGLQFPALSLADFDDLFKTVCKAFSCKHKVRKKI